ncbi:3-deoxy-7-phosphoheptulonate synthase [Anaeroselena agilis]|uniref:3-deoxy-7-phosphoheptulonate synthase n=1 Tax=Anaeroselena agilis TaxID=3063788 RepID=A0ABU3NUJ0_9FIRM|nr:3-deoxy-7-phosphoheptulonate synthase [Selenomonadales bacterium 4137-cl]
MVIVMRPDAVDGQVRHVVNRIEAAGLATCLSRGQERILIGIVGDKRLIATLPVEVFPGVEKVLPVTDSYKLASRQFRPASTVIDVGGVEVGGGRLVVMAGPCAVESRAQLLEAAEIAREGGAQFLRGGAFKPRTSPYSFQGLERQGLEYLAEAREATGLKIVTEVVDVTSVAMVAEYADVLQIGARNMQNFKLLQAVGQAGKPVLLKRGIAATISEWLHAAEYILSEGNYQVMLCERGIRTFEEYTRNTLDLSAVVAAKKLSHLPVVVDPSHGTGRRELVGPMAMAAVAAGADGLMVEMHPNPATALSDGPQSLNPEQYRELMAAVFSLADFLRPAV